MDDRLQRGQALILIALAFVGVAAFIGLAVDAGILFSAVGHLRRSVDAASLAAANQFREGRPVSALDRSANEFINLNSVNPATADIFICDIINPTPDPAVHDAALCPTGSDPHRKFVRVEAQMLVPFAFLPIIGWDSTTIRAEAIAETASVDLVLAIDTSASMAFDLCTDGINNDAADDGTADDCVGFPTSKVGNWSEYEPVGTGGVLDGCNDEHERGFDSGSPFYDPGNYIPANDCHPFEEVRAAAMAMIGRMYFPYDRLSIVTFASTGSTALDLNVGTSLSSAVSALASLRVSADPACSFASTLDPRGCTNTNTQEGLRAAGNQFGAWTREEAVWIVILLSDGGANAARDGASPANWICPGSPNNPTWIKPFCRDPVASSRHIWTNPSYDADDAARDAADWVGCPDSTSPQWPACAGVAPGGQGAVIFTIGLGDAMINNTCDPSYGTCDSDLGEELMRYIAAVGDDTNPATDPCASVASGTTPGCGNYYFSPTGAGLLKVFEAIASRIFTRITH
jgi:hypothetical protein